MMPASTPAVTVIIIKRANKLKEKFSEKGAVSPETAMALKELGLKMRPIIQLLIFRKHIVKVGAKYYFDVERFDNRMIKRFKKFIVGLFKGTSNNSTF